MLLLNSLDGCIAHRCECFAPIYGRRIQGYISVDEPLRATIKVGVSCPADSDDPWSRIDDDCPPSIEGNSMGSRFFDLYYSGLPLAFGRIPR